MLLQKGVRGKLADYLDPNQTIEICTNIFGNACYDYCCFGVDAGGKLSDDRYMVFYNQIASPEGAIRYENSTVGASFYINLRQLSDSIQKLVLTASIDGDGIMGQIKQHTVNILQNGLEVMSLNLDGSHFQKEKAIISMEIYRKGEWRFNIVASGFNGGLGDLLRNYGGEEAMEETAAISNATSTKVSLEKKLEAGAPQLVSLAKPLKVVLEKKNLMSVVAKVALVLDISGSMRERYGNGTVQEIVNKTVPVAVQFDDDGDFELWYYGSKPRRMPSVNMSNYQQAVPRDWSNLMRELGYGNTEPKVMCEVIDEYCNTNLPVYVIFVTDGGVGSESQIKKLLIESSRMPIFWQFIGIGGSSYGILRRLDSMSGRYVDNANFFALDDFRSVSAEELYARLLEEFPQWYKEIKRIGMI